MFYGLGVVRPHASWFARAAAAFAVCAVVETSQLYHAPWLDALRATLPGHLILGSGFDPRDLLSYFLGIIAVVGLERALFRRS
jgi:hypothetical protein